MAPALNEPTTISPLKKDKLKATTTTTSRTTRRQTTLKAAILATNSGSDNKEQKRKVRITTTKITARHTRSKDPKDNSTTTKNSKTNKNQQKVTTTTTTTKLESMGLTAALHNNSNKNNNNNNNNAQITTTSNNKKNNIATTTTTLNSEVVPITTITTNTTTTTTGSSCSNSGSGTDTTQEILANLTINFEEAISAEICLRKQLLDSNLNEEVAKKTNGTEEIKDILVIKGVAVARATATAVATIDESVEQQQHMDELLQKNNNKTTTTTTELQLNEANNLLQDEKIIILQQQQEEQQQVRKAEELEEKEKRKEEEQKAEELKEEECKAEDSKKEERTTEELEDERKTEESEGKEEREAEEFEEELKAEESAEKEEGEAEEFEEELRTEESAVEERESEEFEEVLKAEEPAESEEHEAEEFEEELKAEEELEAKAEELEEECEEGKTEELVVEEECDENLLQDELEARLCQLDGGGNNVQIITTTTTVPEAVEELTAITKITASENVSDSEFLLEQQQPPPQQEQQYEITNVVQQQQQPQQQQQQFQTHVIASGDLEDQDLEEVLKALKNLDPTVAGADALCDLNALFNDVYQQMNYDEQVTNTNTTTTAAAAAAAAAITRATTTTIPGITICATSPIKNYQLHESQLEIDKTQQTIQRKLDFMVRRLRKMQARHMCKHASEELAGVFEYAVHVANNKLNPVMDGMSVISARPLPHVWLEERENPVSTIQAHNLLRKLQNATKRQQLLTNSTSATTTAGALAMSGLNVGRKPRKSSLLVVDTTQQQQQLSTTTPSLHTNSTNQSIVSDNIVPTLDTLAVEEMAQVAGMLQAEMRQVQQAIDSDATASSSGCESVDEMISYNNQMQQPLPIEKRAAWRYARDRAAIAARWSWLLTHIADLELKIRQHIELYNEIVQKKGPVLSDADFNSLSINLIDDDDEQIDNGSCRTRGFLSKQFRKRKLLQTTNIHTISKRAARPSTIKCGCQWPMQPCALCTGRSDPTAPRELPSSMMKPERVALLDSGFHAVLSFPEDVSSSIYSEAIARLSDWQQRAMRCHVKSIAKSIWKAERQASGNGTGAGGKKYDGSGVKRRYIKKKDRLAAEAKEAKNTETSRAGVSVANTNADNGGLIENNGTESTAGTTPLVANKRSKQNCQMQGDRRAIATAAAAGTSSAPSEMMEKGGMMNPQSSNYTALKYVRYNNRKPTMISRKNNNNRFHHNHRNRKAFSSSSSSSSFSATASHRHHINNQYQTYNKNINSNISSSLHPTQQQQQQYQNSNGNSSSSETAHNNLHMHDNWDYVPSMRSRTTSPTHASSGYQKHERSERKRISYDIDNIVIPYSVAASTRVEIIPYKEIPTPKWRVIDSENEAEETFKEEEVKEEQCEIKYETEEAEKEKLNQEIKESIAEENTTTKIDNAFAEQATNEKEAETIKEEPKEEPKIESGEEKAEILKVAKEENVAESLQNGEVSQDSVEKKESNAVEESDIVQTSDEKILEDVKPEKIIESEIEPVANEEIAVEKVIKEETEATEVAEESKNCEKVTELTETESIIQDCKEEETVEDITDSIMSMRHERALIEERRKFQTYLKFPWTTRSRANRRGDSRAESSGANTPDPTSPAPNAISMGVGDHESIPSPAATATLSSSAAPFAPLDSAPAHALHEPFAPFNNSQCRNRKRRRTVSSKKEQERRSQTPDNREFAFPYEPLRFPLNERDFEAMQSLMPGDRRIETKQEGGNRKPVGSCGRGRNGLRRQANTTTVSNAIRSTRPRLSNRPYVLHRDSPTKEIAAADFDAFQQSIASCSQSKQNLFANSQLQMDADDGEETEDETETCGLVDNLVNRSAKGGLFTDDDDADGDGDGDEEEDEDEDDGFQRHPLATTENLLPSTTNGDLQEQEAAHCSTNLEANDSAYAGCRGLFSDGEMDSSDAEPFKDDDVNDPEWNGERPRRRV